MLFYSGMGPVSGRLTRFFPEPNGSVSKTALQSEPGWVQNVFISGWSDFSREGPEYLSNEKVFEY